MIKVIVFDFDGVILESVEVKDKAFYNLFDNLSEEERQRVIDTHRNNPGMNRRKKIALLLTKVLGREACAEDVNTWLKRFTELVEYGLMNCPEVPGIRRLLQALSEKPCYVVSAAPQEELRMVARKRDLAQYFIDIFGSPATKIELLQDIIQCENVLPESILLIGDKISDYNAAQSVGTEFIGRRLPINPTKFPVGTLVIDDFDKNWDVIMNFR